MKVTEKTGKVVTLKAVTTWDDLMITTKEGIVIRTKVKDLRVMGRATQGVKVITLKGKDTISDVAVIRRDENSDEEVF